MVVSPQHFTELTNGYEKTSSGLFMHKGRAAVGALQVRGPLGLYPPNGQGVEVLYDPTVTTGYLYSWDRDVNAARDLQIAARSISLTTYSPGTLNLPAGSVGTSAIAANAVQQLVVNVATQGVWNTTTTNVWVLTLLNGSFTTSGGLLRFEWSLPLYHTVATAGLYIGVGWDGAVQANVGVTNTPALASGAFTISGIYYVGLAAGTHTASIWLDNLTAGTLGVNTAVTSLLYVTEQKR